MVRGFDGMVKPAKGFGAPESIGKGTLLFGRLRLTNVSQKTGMGCAELSEVLAGLSKAELAVHGETNIRGVAVFLAVIFPPADGAQNQSGRCNEGLISTTRAAITHFSCGAHTEIDGKWEGGIT
jgi:hypothetical protein